MSTAQSPRAQHQLAVLFRKTDVSYPRFPPVSNHGRGGKRHFSPRNRIGATSSARAAANVNARIFPMSSSTLDTFPNPRPERDYEIAISCPEFTSVCPMTGLPDFGEIRITYVPDARCVELKSLKYYMIEFRNRGIYYEHVTNQILDDLVAALQPRRMTVVGDFSVRGGIKTVVTAEYTAERSRVP
jgi:7-cyano-7-deazaguanine reductase